MFQLYRMKKDTVRWKDNIDAAAVRRSLESAAFQQDGWEDRCRVR